MKVIYDKSTLFKTGFIGLISNLTYVIILLLITLLLSENSFLTKNTMTLLALLIFIFGTTTLSYLNEINLKNINLNILAANMPRIWHQVLSLPSTAHTNLNKTELTSLIYDYEFLLGSYVSKIYAIASASVQLLLLFVFLFYYSFFTALICFFAFIFLLSTKSIVYFYTLKKKSSYINKKHQSTAILNECLYQIHKIKTSHTEQFFGEKWLEPATAAKKTTITINKIEALSWLIENSCIFMLTLTAIYLKSPPLFFIGIFQISMHSEKFSNDWLIIINFHTLKKRLGSMLNVSSEPKKSYYTPDGVIGELRLVNVSSNYLSNVSLHIPSQSFVALIGETGAGKSSLFKLILGLDNNYTGSILLDQQNIRDLNLNAARHFFGVVLQTTNLFPGTIYSNLCANQRIGLNEAWRLAGIVGLADEIHAMPMKMFTHISDNAGDSLSGGQRQKILIARALATQPKILFLDEATSALDNESQALLFQRLKMLNITLFVISHRLSVTATADRIYRLEGGRVIMVNKDEVLYGTRRALTTQR